MAQVIHTDATLLGLRFVVVCMLLKRTDQVLAGVAYFDPSRVDQNIDRIDPVLHKRVALLWADLMPCLLQNP